MGKWRSEHPLPSPQPCADDGGTKQKSVCYYYDPRISYVDYGETHEMVPHRISMTHTLIKAYGLLDDMDRLRVAPATEEDLELAHDPEYIIFLRDLTPADYNANAETQREAAEKYKLGEVWNELTHCVTNDNPVIENLWDYCRCYAGGSLAAARALASGRYKIAINWSGGMHHACEGEAGGFCYVNDIVVAIKALLHHGRRFIRRVLYLDIDAHHGDGVETAFVEDSRVLTVSFHQFGGDFFPRTGAAVDVGELPAGDDGVCPTLMNVPLQAGTCDGRYHQLFGAIVDRVMAVFEPDAVVMQCGADSLAGDRLAGLGLSVRGHAKCVSIVKGLGLSSRSARSSPAAVAVSRRSEPLPAPVADVSHHSSSEELRSSCGASTSSCPRASSAPTMALQKWKADFGSTLGSSVILGASSVSSNPPTGPCHGPAMRCFWPPEPAAGLVLLRLSKDACFWPPEPAARAGAAVLRGHVLARAPIWQGRAQAQPAGAAVRVGGGCRRSRSCSRRASARTSRTGTTDVTPVPSLP